MEISDWVLVGSVIVALVLGIRSLRQTKDLRRKEYRNKLLDEIIDWASDIASTVRTWKGLLQGSGMEIDRQVPWTYDW